MFTNKTILITGGTGSLGKVLIKRLLSEDCGLPKKIIVFSRDEAKQHAIRIEYLNKKASTDEVIFNNFKRLLEFRIGDIRDFESVARTVRGVDVVFNAAALKQVPSCEYFPAEAVRTNTLGPENIIKAIRLFDLPVETVVGISTDKACKPVNVMGMTKAIQERVFIAANIECPRTRFICVRYGNVLASRGSVIPLFHDQIKTGGPVTITTSDMTRFLLSLNDAVDTIFAAVKDALPGETYIPIAKSAHVMDIAHCLIGERPIKLQEIGIRPGEKIHEILISDEEAYRTEKRGDYYVIKPMLPELNPDYSYGKTLSKEFSSADRCMNKEEVLQYLTMHQLLIEQCDCNGIEMLR
ncbi:MAG: polysaccharide biosynthesis protein [Methanospirillaceae archaeon]|nr:polysaccharide biosynthesis protein [Methanospirillaceae archaeon]